MEAEGTSDIQYTGLENIDISKFINPTYEECHGKFKPDVVERMLNFHKETLEKSKEEKISNQSVAEWDEKLKMAKVIKFTKNITKNFAHVENKSLYLFPEECLCLIDMRLLILKWNKKVLSMQSAYNLLLKTGSGCTFEEFRTFSFLCKLGFRVFRHKKNLKNNSSGPKDLTKVPVISSKKKTNKNNYMKIENIKKPKSFPKIESGWVVIPKPPLYCIPYNIQPYYDTYTFNVSFISNSVVITDVISFFNTVDLKKTPFIENESMVYDDLKTIGKYPVYEMNICKTIKSIINDFNEPPIKRLKYFCELERNDNIYHEMEFKRLCIPSMDIITPLTSSNDECHSDEINDKINSNDKTQRTLNIYEDTKIEEETNDQIQYNLNIDEHSKLKTLIDSNPNIDINYTTKNNDLNKITTSDTIHEDEDFGIELKLPKHIRKKLFSIKPKNVHDNPSKNVNCVHRAIFDVYFPNNKEAKTKLLAPDFRVIVFNDNLETFPNIYDVSICNPNDNVCTLWAIVNSSTVSFYNVNNIIIPKSTDWKMEH